MFWLKVLFVVLFLLPPGRQSPESLFLSLPPLSVWKSEEGGMFYTSPSLPGSLSSPQACPAHLPKQSSSPPLCTHSHSPCSFACLCVTSKYWAMWFKLQENVICVVCFCLTTWCQGKGLGGDASRNNWAAWDILLLVTVDSTHSSPCFMGNALLYGKKQILSAQGKAKVLEHLLSAWYVLVRHTFTIYWTLPTSCLGRGG